jgi:hypothetical protein
MHDSSFVILENWDVNSKVIKRSRKTYAFGEIQKMRNDAKKMINKIIDKGKK